MGNANSGRKEGNPGNKGGKPYSKKNREKAATLKGLSLDWMIKVMRGKNEALKKEVALKIATTCLPQEHKHGGDESNPTPILINVIPSDNSNPQDSEAQEKD